MRDVHIHQSACTFLLDYSIEQLLPDALLARVAALLQLSSLQHNLAVMKDTPIGIRSLGVWMLWSTGLHTSIISDGYSSGQNQTCPWQ